MLGWILLAAGIAFAIKLIGYVVPRRLFDSPVALRVAGCLTVGLLASLTAVNAVVTGQDVVLDARLGALAAAAIALMLRAPFLLVVVVGAAAAAGLRLLGWG